MKIIQLQAGDAYERSALPSKHAIIKMLALILGAASMFAAGCDSSPTSSPSAAKPAEPAVPDDVQSAADAFLGKETTVLVFGDLAKTGNRQMLAANVVPKTPKNNLPGTIVTRAVLAEESGGSW